MPLKVKKVTGPTIAASVQFDGSTQYLSGTGTLVSGATNFTAEAWIYLTSTPSGNAAGIIGTSNAAASPLGWLLRITGATYAPANRVSFQETWSANELFSDTILSNNTWYHIAAVRSGSVSSIFINGIKQATTGTFNQSYTSTNFVVGRDWPNLSLEYFPGYISNVRVVSGTALYTSNFTPPAATLTAISGTTLLTCHDTTIRDASTNNFTITNNNTATVSTVSPFPVLRSVSFNGSNQNLRISNSAALQFGTGDFTVECWIYGNTSQVAYARALSVGGTYGAGGQIGLEIDIQGPGGLIMEVNSGASTLASIVIYAATTWKNQWNHVAVTRVGTTFYAFYNGTLAGSTTPSSINLIGTDGVSIGSSTGNTYYWNGYISNVRLIKGTALYTASFTVPTAPLTAITSCSLLTCNDQTIRDASTNNFTITNNNTATVSTVTPFTASLASSMKFKRTINNIASRSVLFNGSSQYLTVGSIGNFNFLHNGLSSWTIEGWVYFNTLPASNSKGWISNGANTSTDLGISLLFGNSSANGLDVYISKGVSGGPASIVGYSTGATVFTSTNTWYHVALTFNSSTQLIKLYINGVASTFNLISGYQNSVGFSYLNSNAAYTTAIGRAQYSAPFGYFDGYMSNTRITNSVLYTASFTPLTSPLTAISGTQLLTCNAATIVDASSNNFTITNNGTATVSSVVVPFSITPGAFKVKKSPGVYMVATGGDLITTVGSYKVHTFTTVGTSSFVVSSLGNTPTIECLIVGGGGGGGGRAMGGGGGGGGVVYTSSALLATGSFSAIVGAGGVAATGMATSTGKSGGNTLFTYNSITTTALGGGGGGTEGYVALSGANGGGGQNNGGVPGSGSAGGFPGGSGSVADYLNNGCGGGGGGAGGAGVAGVAGTGGNGGIGAIYNITGSAYYGGGGGGGGNGFRAATAGAGGLGGGGLGGRTSAGTAGTANTGGGGGGGGYNGTTGASETNGGNGGSGIILIKYKYTD